MSILKGLLGGKTVDSVLSTFNQAVTDLEEIQREQANLAIDKAAQIEELNLQIKAHDREAGRALRIADKIKGLLA